MENIENPSYGVFGGSPQKFDNPKPHVFASRFAIIETWWILVVVVSCRILGRFQNRSRRDTYTHTPTLAQGRLEERHDKAGRTPEDAEPSFLYGPLSISLSHYELNCSELFEHVSETGCIQNQLSVMGVDQQWTVMISLKRTLSCWVIPTTYIRTIPTKKLGIQRSTATISPLLENHV